MRRIIFSGILFMFLAQGAFAQNLGMQFTPEERAQMQTEWMEENLQLNDSQLVKVEALNLEYALKMEKIKEINGNLSKLRAARKISEEKDKKLKKLLDKEQFEFYLDKRKEMQKKAREMANERKKEGGVEQLNK
jgi:predicted nuclease with TOPRIM domain